MYARKPSNGKVITGTFGLPLRAVNLTRDLLLLGALLALLLRMGAGAG